MNRTLLVCSLLIAMQAMAEEQMAFVFEIIRHGARNTLIEPYTDGFTVGIGQLTPQGMRQRYLMGRYARERYTNQYKLLSSEFTPGEVYVQSTDVNRTIQSGYSELMGLYPPGNGAKLS